MKKEVLEYFLPTELLKYFTIVKVEEKLETSTKEIVLEIELEEINNIPSGYDSTQYESKGFTAATRIQDFPIRGKAVYLLIKRRRWRHKTNKKEIIQNAYSLVAEGSRLTQELSNFLKGTGRDPGRYN
jgi:transposase